MCAAKQVTNAGCAIAGGRGETAALNVSAWVPSSSAVSVCSSWTMQMACNPSSHVCKSPRVMRAEDGVGLMLQCHVQPPAPLAVAEQLQLGVQSLLQGGGDRFSLIQR